jgi:hypothetical protein
LPRSGLSYVSSTLEAVSTGSERWLRAAALTWMGAAFFVAMVSAATVLAIFGIAGRGTEIALKITARWSFLLFWLAYTGGATRQLFGSRFNGLARRGRELGLAFASAQLVHLGLILWLVYIAAGPDGDMLFFWIGMFFTYSLALLSLPYLRDPLGGPFWRIVKTLGLEYIAIVFATDFIVLPLEEHSLAKYPPTYAPFGLMVMAGMAIRLIAFGNRTLLSRNSKV